MTPDIVYVVRAGERNEELRYSIRSVVANLPHGKVWIAGYCPTWLGNDIGVIKVQSRPGGHQSAKANLRAACEHPEVSESFMYFNDDFFVMQPMDALPVMHRGSLADAAKNDRMASAYQRHIGKTLGVLSTLGITDPLTYDMHAPMTVTKTGMLQALELCAKAPMLQERTLFGNMQEVGGVRAHNFKVRRQDRGWSTWLFISTNDNTFARLPVGQYIRSQFTEPSPFEVSPPPVARGVRPVPTGRRPIRRHAGTSTIRRIGGRAA